MKVFLQQTGARLLLWTLFGCGWLAASRPQPARGEDKSPVGRADPLVWIPAAKPPEFRALVKPSDYQKRLDQAWSELAELELSAAHHLPAAGVKVLEVEPNSQASRLGLQVDDVITAIDGETPWSTQAKRDKRLPHVLTVAGPEGQQRKITMQPGDFGVLLELVWQPERLYYRSPRRNEKFDKEALVAIAKRQTDPELAETAWNHAIEKGYVPDYLSAMCGAELAMNGGRPETALEFVPLAMKADPAAGEVVNPNVLYSIAIANYKLELALEIARKHFRSETAKADSLAQLIAMHRARPLAERTAPPPSQLAQTMHRRNVIDELYPAALETSQLRRFRLSGPFTFSPPSGAYNQAYYTWNRPLNGIDAVMQLKLRAQDAQETQFAKYIHFAITDESVMTPEQEEAPVAIRIDPLLSLELRVNPPPVAIVGHSSAAGLEYRFNEPLIQADGAHLMQLRLVRVGGQGEIFLNGSRIAYVPVRAETSMLGLEFMVVGANAQVQSVKVDELIERR